MRHLIKYSMKRYLKKEAPLINIPYEAQLKMKENRALNSLKSFNSAIRKLNSSADEFLDPLSNKKSVPYAMEPIQRSPIINGYRNKINAMIGFNEEGNIIVGHALYITDSVKAYKRKIIFPEISGQLDMQNHILIIKLFEQYIREYSKYLPSKRHFDKYWQAIMIRSNRKSESLIRVNFNGTKLPPDTIIEAKDELVEKFLPRLQNEHIDIRSLFFQLSHFSTSGSEQQFPSQLVWGDNYISETVDNKVLHLGPNSVFPINTGIAEILYQLTKRIIEESVKCSSRKTLVLDLCCGTGTLAVLLSDIANKVIGVDISPLAIEDAKSNAAVNNISNIEHICQDVEDFLQNFINSEAIHFYDDIITVINLTKMGLSTKFCSNLRQCQSMKTILCISDHLEDKLISNLLQFCKINETNPTDPFRLIKAIPLDPFPHTTDVEMVLQLTR